MAKYKVLSTKKLEPSLIELAKENNIEIIEQEFISIKPKTNFETCRQVLIHLKKTFAVFTSANAVNSLTCLLHPDVESDPFYLPGWNIFCLAGKTKEAIQEVDQLRGNIIGEANNAADLARKIIEQDVKEIVFFCGKKRRDELPDILKEAEITVYEIPIYETIETPIVFNDDFDAVLFFSPSAVQSFFSVNQLNSNTVCFAVGQTTADSITAITNNKIIIGKTPSQEVLLQEVINYFKSMVSKN